MEIILVIFAVIILFFLALLVHLIKRNKYLEKDANDLRDLYNHTKKLYDNLLSSQKNRPKAVELQEFLIDLLQGDALVSVHRVDNSNLFMYSPRDKNEQ